MTIYSLNILLPNLEPVCCSMSSSNYCFLTCIQISQKAGKVVWYSHLFKNFPQFVVIHRVKGCGVVNKAEVGVVCGTLLLFLQSCRCWQLDLWFLCLFWIQFEHLEVLSSHTVEASPGENEHYFDSSWDDCNCVIVWAFFGIAFLWDWNWTWPFPVLWLLLSFPILLTYWMSHFSSSIF